MATKLSIYQDACLAIRDRKLMSLTENREARRQLDTVWQNGGVLTCLQAGLWNFAKRSAQLDYSSDVSPPWGYHRAFNLPDDWVRAMAVCTDEFFATPLTDYSIESGFLFANLDTLWAAWVSSDVEFGMNLGKWPENFSRYVGLYFGHRIVGRVTNSKETADEVEKEMGLMLAKAKSTDAMEESTAFAPPGTWLKNRRGRRSRDDRGNPNKLIG